MRDNSSKHSFLNIKNRILFFALLVTLVPSLGMGLLLNNMLHTTLTEKVEQRLLDSSYIIEKEISLWFKKQRYDLSVLSDSLAIRKITQNLSQTDKDSKNEYPVLVKDLETYLATVQKYGDYERLFVLNTKGTVIAASKPSDNHPAINLPKISDDLIQDNKMLTGDVYSADETPLMQLGIPLFADTEQYGNYSGILVAETRLEEIFATVKDSLADKTGKSETHGSLYRLKDNHPFFMTNHEGSYQQTNKPLPGDQAPTYGKSLSLRDFHDTRGIRVIGITKNLEEQGWGLIVSEDYASVFAKATDSRNHNLIIVCSFGLMIGFFAYLFARQIINPVQALANGAQKVAEGELDIVLPVNSNDEVGFATRVFNEMVVKLKNNQVELERLATTDPLTRLNNRNQIMQNLLHHFELYQRYKSEFAILMIDVDHFKRVNDNYSHLAGDKILVDLAEIFQNLLRKVDSVGRYGGEEFLVTLGETDRDKAQQAAERIRQMVEAHRFSFEEAEMRVTVSIGLAIIAARDGNVDRLLSRADKALYEAKNNGRNRIVYLEEPAGEKTGAKVLSIASTTEQ